MTQLAPFIISIICGIGIGMVFDLFRIHRRKFNVGAVFLTIQDILFWLFFAFVVCYFTFYVSDGVFRAYEFLGFGMGILIHIKLFSKFFNIILEFVWKIISSITFWLMKILLFPLMLLLKPLKSLFKLIKKILKNEKNKLDRNKERFRKFAKRI